jgi:hypothetical protein
MIPLTISDITNFYKGDQDYAEEAIGPHKKELSPLTISDIVSRELWEEAQEKIKATSTDKQAPDVGDMTQSFT